MFARDVRYLDDHDATLGDPDKIAAIRANILEGDTYIARGVVDRDVLERIRAWLTTVGRNSIPNYLQIAEGAPNFHRMNRWDPRAHVAGCFHQFVFFPWNDDPFGMFDLFRSVYRMKNLLSGLPADKFLSAVPEDGCAARLAFQYYPRGIGGLNRHADPVDHHQLTVPTMLLSSKGTDYRHGGAYVERADGQRVDLDALATWGDVAYFNARIVHGVEQIDPGVDPDWLSFEGRWMLLFAVNKLHDNAAIPDSVDLGLAEGT